jgi:cytochrome c peroxidase
MIKKILAVGVSLTISGIASNELIKKAKDAGLKPVPTDKKELLKLIDNKDNKITPERVELGKKLFFDPRLSKSNLISCNTCHNLALGGDDGVSVATGHKWSANPHHLNSPTVYNAVFAKKQFWDGRSPDLEDQATGPIQAEPEMAMSKESAVKNIKSIPAYVDEFKKAYPNEEITIKTIGKAIGNFERTLITSSNYDKFLSGDTKALNEKEREGLKIFIDKGCASCHNGVALGGEMQKFPLIKPYKYSKIGDFNGNKDGMVKVPTLRNIAQTAPYYHNGAIWSLDEAVKVMGETQLGIELKDEEIKSIVVFLNSLTGDKPKIDYPNLPDATDKILKPEL